MTFKQPLNQSRQTHMSITRYIKGKDCIPGPILCPGRASIATCQPQATRGELPLYWCPKARITPANGKQKPLLFQIRHSSYLVPVQTREVWGNRDPAYPFSEDKGTYLPSPGENFRAFRKAWCHNNQPRALGRCSRVCCTVC